LLVVSGDPVDDIGCLQNPDNLLAIMKGGLFVKEEVVKQEIAQGRES
jgi:hypothetical protein